jgi:integrase
VSIYRRKVNGKPIGRYVAEFYFRGQLHRRTGLPDRETAKHWINSEQLKLGRGEVGYVKPMLKAQVVPLVGKFTDHLRAKGRDEHYAYIAEKRLKRMVEGCGWVTLEHVTAASVEAWRDGGPKFRGKLIGAKTINQYIDTAFEFGRWLSRKPQSLLALNPLADLDRLPEIPNPEYRRAATVEEFDNLLAACSADRRAYYLFRLYVPVRTRTVAATTWRMLHLDDEQPWILFPAYDAGRRVNKSKRDERSPIPHFLAAQLRQLKKETKGKADDAVFPTVWTIDDLRADLASAGVAFDQGNGKRRLDLHAFRKTLVRWAKRAGVPMEDASLLLHHKSIATTRKHYDDDAVDPDLWGAVAKRRVVGKINSTGGAA